MRRLAGVLAVLALAGCASEPPPAPPPPPAPVPAPPPQPPAPEPVADMCGAAEMQRLVGRPRTEIPVPLDPSRQRVACTSCPVTLDHRPDRLNFYFDAQTGIIKEVKCG